ncbi:MAG: hypothetical protein AAF633_24225, partial [Chloroflexota bacterium]
MKSPTLSVSQTALLSQLIENKENGELIEPFIPLPIGPGQYIIYLKTKPSIQVRWISDLDVLCLTGYLTFQWNRMSTAKAYWVSQFTVTEPNRDIVENIDPETLKELPIEFRAVPKEEDVRSVNHIGLKEALGDVIPYADFQDTIALLTDIDWMIQQVKPNHRTILQKVDEVQMIAQSFMRAARTFEELSKHSALHKALGEWQIDIIARVEKQKGR